MERKLNDFIDFILIGEIKLILAEKHTLFALMRIVISVILISLFIMGFLIVNLCHYDAQKVPYFLIPFSILNFVFLLFGFYLIIKFLIQIRHYDEMIKNTVQ
ncbi:MAG: hypothetical protein C0190_05320 [Thermodesulfobacterium geofontis]|uniref:Uncharacterized protein n=1 Tax=Thermodesulfobacterium geofontis TaxID=1295609 RepID=A0A2N7PMT2_9BACT|nr:MAG: hypothetical protein C0190_05320 [Thermodesulfobacterium geofontis]